MEFNIKTELNFPCLLIRKKASFYRLYIHNPVRDSLFIDNFCGQSMFKSLGPAIDRVNVLRADPGKWKTTNAAKYVHWPIWCALPDGTFIEAPTTEEDVVVTTLMMHA
jgi:hypothetical protein